MTRLIVDTDTAGDDVFSLLIALRHPRARLEAITVSCGNVRFEQEVENALYTVEMAGRSGEVPVYPGCRKPLVGEWVGAEYVHGNDGMGDCNFPQAKQRPEAEHAVDELVRRINESPGELTILCQAPLTNLATAVSRDPSIAGKVRALYLMGGGFGNITPAAEYNFFVDPEAAKIVVNAGFPLTLFTWSLTRTHGVFNDDQLARIDALGIWWRDLQRIGEHAEHPWIAGLMVEALVDSARKALSEPAVSGRRSGVKSVHLPA